MSKELATIPSQPRQLADRNVNYEPTTFAEALQFAEQIAKSDLVPSDYKGKPANVFVAMQHGKELGISPMQAIQGIANINGRPGVFGDLQLAIVQAHPHYENHREWFTGEGENLTAHFKIKRRNQDEHEETFSVADAKRAGLWDERPTINRSGGGSMANPSPWFRYPKRMLKFRARSFGLRDTFADALKGIKSVEELSDYTVIEGHVERGEARPVASVPSEDKEIGPTLAAEWSNAAKLANIKSATIRAYLKNDLKVETSIQIKQSQLAAAYEWIRRNTVDAAPAASTQAASGESTTEKAKPVAEDSRPGLTPEEEELLGKIDSAFSMLGMDLIQQADIREKYKADLPGLYAELGRLADEGAAS